MHLVTAGIKSLGHTALVKVLLVKPWHWSWLGLSVSGSSVSLVLFEDSWRLSVKYSWLVPVFSLADQGLPPLKLAVHIWSLWLLLTVTFSSHHALSCWTCLDLWFCISLSPSFPMCNLSFFLFSILYISPSFFHSFSHILSSSVRYEHLGKADACPLLTCLANWNRELPAPVWTREINRGEMTHSKTKRTRCSTHMPTTPVQIHRAAGPEA